MIFSVAGAAIQRWSDNDIVINFLAAKGMRSHHTRDNYERDIKAFRDFLGMEFDAGPDDTLRLVDVAHVAAYHSHLVEAVLLGELSERTVIGALLPCHRYLHGASNPLTANTQAL